jgi:hypothetical protein
MNLCHHLPSHTSRIFELHCLHNFAFACHNSDDLFHDADRPHIETPVLTPDNVCLITVSVLPSAEVPSIPYSKKGMGNEHWAIENLILIIPLALLSTSKPALVAVHFRPR